MLTRPQSTFFSVIKGPPQMQYPGQLPPNTMGVPPGASPYPANTGAGYNQPPGGPAPSGMPQPFTAYPSTPYPPNQQSYSPYDGQQQPISQPQHYQMQQNAPPPPHGSYSQPQNPGVYQNPQTAQFPQGPYPGGNPAAFPPTNNPYPGNQVPYPSHPAPQNPAPQNAARYPGHFVPFDTSAGSFQNPSGQFPQNITHGHSAQIPGGQGMGAAYSQHVSQTSYSPQHAGPAPQRAPAKPKVRNTVNHPSIFFFQTFFPCVSVASLEKINRLELWYIM